MSGFPSAPVGVWHSPQTSNLSTRYCPRATVPVRLDDEPPPSGDPVDGPDDPDEQPAAIANNAAVKPSESGRPVGAIFRFIRMILLRADIFVRQKMTNFPTTENLRADGRN